MLIYPLPRFALFGCLAYSGDALVDPEVLSDRDSIQLYSNDTNSDADSCPNPNADKARFSKVNPSIPDSLICGGSHWS